MRWLTEAFEPAFMQRALLAGLMTAAVTSVVGTWVVIRGLAFMGDALAHGVIPGIAVAVIWGWVPALLWVVFGAIFIGAVHDFGALIVSMRNRGQTVGDIAGRVLAPRTRLWIELLGISLLLLTFTGFVVWFSVSSPPVLGQPASAAARRARGRR